MFRLLRKALLPALTLEAAVKNWPDISLRLRESPRERMRQVAYLIENHALLS